jgi:hypothetical protein
LDDAVLGGIAARHEPGAYEEAVARLARMHRKPGDPRSLIDIQLLAAAFNGPGSTVPFCGPAEATERHEDHAAGDAPDGNAHVNGGAGPSHANGHDAIGYAAVARATNGHAVGGKLASGAAPHANSNGAHQGGSGAAYRPAPARPRASLQAVGRPRAVPAE